MEIVEGVMNVAQEIDPLAASIPFSANYFIRRVLRLRTNHAASMNHRCERKASRLVVELCMSGVKHSIVTVGSKASI
jgi:hypothetical protein